MNINFKFPLRIGPLGFFDMNNDTKDAVKENIKLTLLTNKNERLVTNVGSSFHYDVFNQSEDEIDSIIKDQINSTFKEYFDYIKIDKINIIHPNDINKLNDNDIIISIEYSYKGINGFSDKISILLN